MTYNGSRSPSAGFTGLRGSVQSRRCATLATGCGIGIAVLALASFAAPAQADLIVEVLNSTATSGGTGSFDIDITDTGGTYAVSGFSIEPTVGLSSGVEFTDFTTNTAEPYIFGTYQSGPSPFSFNTFPTNDATASDVDFTPLYEVTLNTGDTYGLGTVKYSVAAGTTPGPVGVTLAAAGTSLSDIDGNAITFTTADGTISVVPLPKAATMGSVVIALPLLARVLRRRRWAGCSM